ncbi:MAG: vitamin K epoxide reductase family protein [Ktedonobacterales bacterium]
MSTRMRGVSDMGDVAMERQRRMSFGEAVAGAPGLIALIAMAVAGIAIAVYLITVEADHVPLICSSSGLVDCASVLNSSYSRVPFTNVPITVPGLLWFVGSGALAGFALVRLRQGRAEPPRLRLAQFLWSAAGMVFVLYLVYAEIVQLHRICAWCTVIHVLTLLTFLLTLQRLQQPDAAYHTTRPARVNPHPSARNARGRAGGGARHGAVPSRRALARTRRRQ